MARQISTPPAPTGLVLVDTLVAGARWEDADGGTVTLRHARLGAAVPAGEAVPEWGRPWTGAEAAALDAAAALWEQVCNIDFVAVSDPALADLRHWLAPQHLVGALAWHELPRPERAVPLVGVFADDAPGWTERGLARGGFGFITLLHELGHALGLAHPHGDAADGQVFPGVSAPTASGLYGLNQGIWTTMSYNDGWSVARSSTLDHGWQATPMALDVAAAQAIYGPNPVTGAGDDTYRLPLADGPGAFWSCLWDVGGTDALSAAGADSPAVLDLRTAPLSGPEAGGHVSRVIGVAGGVTLAAGVWIEQAIGGAGADLLIGHDGDNTLTGGLGDDTVDGGAGLDTARYVHPAARYLWGLDPLTGGMAVLGPEGRDSLTGIERLAFADAEVDLSVIAPARWMQGGSAADRMIGTAGADRIFGQAGADDLRGLAGDDWLDGGAGADRMRGGPGHDTYVVEDAGDRAHEARGQGFDTVQTSLPAYQLPQNLEAALRLTPGTLTGGKGADVLIGSAGADHLSGGRGADHLSGGDGADVLVGGRGRDVLTGGAGAMC